MLKISIVIPLFNEEVVVQELVDRLREALRVLNCNFELIFVDDGSSDSTFVILKEIASKDERLKIIRFSRNFGQHPAISAGLNICTGDYIIVMDGDLQDNPGVLSSLISKASEGWDIVFVLRKNRQITFSYKLLQRSFYALLSKISDLNFDPEIGNFSLISRKVQNSYLALNEKILYYPAALNWLGYKSTTLEINQDKRFGNLPTKYNFSSRLRLALSVILSNSQKPLQLSVLGGFILSLGSAFFAALVVFLKIFANLTPSGWTSLMTAICFLGGVQLISIGVIGLYVGDVSKRVQLLPAYNIAERVN